MNKVAYLIIIIGLVVSIGIVLIGESKSINDKGLNQSIQNVEIKDGVQYVTINAKVGYWPKISSAKAGIPTKLIVNTDRTYDCSSSLIIRSLGFQKVLAQTGKEIIDLGTQQSGQSVQGLCSMGMYNFKINFD